ncbi:MAG: ribonuclease D [Rhodospirillales bacterium]|nr:ribonuclease D [Rhodospirillales bacterium]
MSIIVHKGDLPDDIQFGNSVAVDSETMGLDPARDRLCLVQLSSGDGDCHLVQLPDGNYDAPNLKALMADQTVLKIFHYARFDVAVIRHYLGVETTPIYCTKIASKLVRTYTDRHGLKDLCRELLGVELSKQQQSSDWGAAVLSEEQLSYAASDVLHLHRLKQRLDEMIDREGRRGLLDSCLEFLPTRAELDLRGWGEEDIFHH